MRRHLSASGGQQECCGEHFGPGPSGNWRATTRHQHTLASHPRTSAHHHATMLAMGDGARERVLSSARASVSPERAATRSYTRPPTRPIIPVYILSDVCILPAPQVRLPPRHAASIYTHVPLFIFIYPSPLPGRARRRRVGERGQQLQQFQIYLLILMAPCPCGGGSSGSPWVGICRPMVAPRNTFAQGYCAVERGGYC